MSAELLALIVEDKYLDRLSIVEMAEEAGLTPIEVGNPKEATELLKSRSDVAIIIVGAEIIQSQRSRELVSLLEEQSDTMVLITADSRFDGIDLANHGVLRKPFHRLSVVNKLRRLSRELTARPETK